MNQEFRGCLEVFLGAAVWGTIGVFVMELNKAGATPVMTAFLRMLFAAGIMGILSMLHGGIASFRIARKALWDCVLLGFLSQGLYNICYNLAIVQAGVSVSAVLLNTAPLFTAFVSKILLKETFSHKKIAALVLNMAGCMLAVTGGRLSVVRIAAGGIIFGVLAGFLYALTPILGRAAGEGCDVFVMSTYSYLFAALSLGLWYGPAAVAAGLDGHILFLSFLFALLPTALAYLIYFLGVQKIKETSKVPVIASVETLVAILLGMVLYGENVQAGQWLGIVIIFVSIALMNKKEVRR